MGDGERMRYRLQHNPNRRVADVWYPVLRSGLDLTKVNDRIGHRKLNLAQIYLRYYSKFPNESLKFVPEIPNPIA
jgi:hypothetical protein